jgi:hypothetical protein
MAERKFGNFERATRVLCPRDFARSAELDSWASLVEAHIQVGNLPLNTKADDVEELTVVVIKGEK